MVANQSKRLVWPRNDRTRMGTFAVSAKARTHSLQIPQRARCRTTPLRSDREKCLSLTSPFIEPGKKAWADRPAKTDLGHSQCFKNSHSGHRAAVFLLLRRI